MTRAFSVNVSATTMTTYDTSTSVSQSGSAIKFAAVSWCDVLPWCHLMVALVGIVANSATFVTLMRTSDMFSPAIRLLLKHQSLADLSVCVLAPVFLLQPPMWRTEQYFTDSIICHAWHSQMPYWGAVYLSAANLGIIAIERYMAVCRPLRHRQVNGTHLFYAIIAVYLVGCVFIIPGCFQVHFIDGECIRGFSIQGRTGKDVYLIYSVIWFVFIFALPVTVYCVMYGRVISTLKRRQHSETMPRTNVTDRAQSNLTKTAILLTSTFAVTIGFDACVYVLGKTGVVEYEIGSTLNKLGLFFTLFNSVINPFVYVGLMPQFRLNMWKAFLCRT